MWRYVLVWEGVGHVLELTCTSNEYEGHWGCAWGWWGCESVLGDYVRGVQGVHVGVWWVKCAGVWMWVWVKIILNVCVEKVCMWGCARMSVYFDCTQYIDASISEVVSTKHVWRRDRTKQQFLEKIPEQCLLLHWPVTQYRHKFFISLMHDRGFGLIEPCHMFTTLSEDRGEHVQIVHACIWQSLIRPKLQHAQSSDRDTWLLRV